MSDDPTRDALAEALRECAKYVEHALWTPEDAADAILSDPRFLVIDRSDRVAVVERIASTCFNGMYEQEVSDVLAALGWQEEDA